MEAMNTNQGLWKKEKEAKRTSSKLDPGSGLPESLQSPWGFHSLRVKHSEKTEKQDALKDVLRVEEEAAADTWVEWFEGKDWVLQRVQRALQN